MLYVHDGRRKGLGRRKDDDGTGLKEFPGMGPYMVKGETILSYPILAYWTGLDWIALNHVWW
jgi:hypothetical protein